MSRLGARQRSEVFDYAFTRLLGAGDLHEPAPFRVHVVIPPAHGEEALDAAVAFSFPLCGPGDRDWTLDLALSTLRAQAMEFSHHVNDLEVTDVIGRLWDLAHFFLEPGSADASGTRHLVVRIVADLARDPLYVCIHEDVLSEQEAVAMGHRHWRMLRDACSSTGGRIRSRSDGDYSPSKPLAKAPRKAEPASTSTGHP